MSEKKKIFNFIIPHKFSQLIRLIEVISNSNKFHINTETTKST